MTYFKIYTNKLFVSIQFFPNQDRKQQSQKTFTYQLDFRIQWYQICISVLPIIWYYANLYNTYLNPIFTVQWVQSYSTHCRRCQYHFLPSPLQYFLSVNVLRACNGSAIATRQNLKRQRWREVWFRDIS